MSSRPRVFARATNLRVDELLSDDDPLLASAAAAFTMVGKSAAASSEAVSVLPELSATFPK